MKYSFVLELLFSCSLSLQAFCFLRLISLPSFTGCYTEHESAFSCSSVQCSYRVLYFSPPQLDVVTSKINEITKGMLCFLQYHFKSLDDGISISVFNEQL